MHNAFTTMETDVKLLERSCLLLFACLLLASSFLPPNPFQADFMHEPVDLCSFRASLDLEFGW